MSNFAKALENINQRRQKINEITLKRQNAIYNEIPEIKKIQENIIKNNSYLLKSISEKKQDINHITEKIKTTSMNYRKQIEFLLEQNGYDKNYLDIKHYCKICDDTGYKDGYRCECLIQEEKKVNSYLYRSDSYFPDISFDKFNLSFYPRTQYEQTSFTIYEYMEKVFTSCINYANNFSNSSPSIFMSGDTGLGKSFLSKSIGNVCIDNGIYVINISAPDLFRYLNEEYFGKSKENNKGIKDVLECELLIIDDLGSEFENQFSNSILFNIINTRLDHSLPTIINTNLTIENLKKRYENRIVSRLLTLYNVLKFYGNDIKQLKLVNKDI